MAETLISPGVLARENDQSQITSQPIQAGAAIVGPTVLGKKGVPKLVTSYSEFLANFGSTFSSGSDQFTYFTSVSAYNYFNNGGTSLLVDRVNSGSFSPAVSTLVPAVEAESGNLLVGGSLLTELTSGGSGGTAGTFADKDLATVTGTGSGGKVDIVTSTSLGKLLTTADALLPEINAGTNPTDCGTAVYTDVIITQGSTVSGKATVTVTGTTAPTITGITVTTPGTGYVAGGNTLTGATVTQDDDADVVYVTFDSPTTWTGTFSVRGALIYDSSSSNYSICVLDFGEIKTITSQTLTVTLPENTTTTALIRFE